MWADEPHSESLDCAGWAYLTRIVLSAVQLCLNLALHPAIVLFTNFKKHPNAMQKVFFCLHWFWFNESDCYCAFMVLLPGFCKK